MFSSHKNQTQKQFQNKQEKDEKESEIFSSLSFLGCAWVLCLITPIIILIDRSIEFTSIQIISLLCDIFFLCDYIQNEYNNNSL